MAMRAQKIRWREIIIRTNLLLTRSSKQTTTRRMTKTRKSQKIQDGFVVLGDGTELPFTKVKNSPLNFVVAHGLGSDPAAKSHENDISYGIWNDCCRILSDAAASSSSSSSSSSAAGECTGIYYTARGHGKSRGWDRQARTTTSGRTDDDRLLAEPFTWPELAKDMLTVADQTGLDNNNFTVFGQSMGAASSLLLAMSEEGNRRIKALVLARPPRIWEARQGCAKKGYEMAAATYKEQNPGSYHYLPLLGAALTDLPGRNDDNNAYRNITVPVLILSHGQDDNHPILSGQQLSEVIPHATFHKLASNEEEARRIWPKVIAEWLVQQGLVVEGSNTK